jgi:hypothetical protein
MMHRLLRPLLPDGAFRDAFDQLLCPLCSTRCTDARVVCNDLRPAHNFLVELKLANKKANGDDDDAVIKALAANAINAIARFTSDRHRLSVEWTSYRIADALVVFVRIPTHVAGGRWIGEVISTAISDEYLDRAPLTNVEVTPIIARWQVVRSQVTYMACYGEAVSKGGAWRKTWRPTLQAIETDIITDAVERDNDVCMWASPVELRGIAAFCKRKREDCSSSEDDADDGADDDGDGDDCNCIEEGGDGDANDTSPAWKLTKMDELESTLSKLPANVAVEVRRRRDEAEHMDHSTKIKADAWLSAVARLPVGCFSPQLFSLAKCSRKDAMAQAVAALDAETHGMTDAKDVVLQLVGQLLTAPESRLRALGLQGPPGCGKTSFATRAIKVALGRPAQVINLGGAKDSSVLLGHDFTYASSRLGKIFSTVSALGVCDPVLVFDELDKVSDSSAGREIINVLMCMVDPTQNAAFTDNYLAGVPLDLSRALFVFTFNDIDRVDPILLDRMRVVRVADSNCVEKRSIILRHVMPRIVKECNMHGATLSDDALDLLTSPHICGSHGMRGIEKVLEGALLKANMRAIRIGGDMPDLCIGRADVQDAAKTSGVHDPLSCTKVNTMYC